MRITKNKFWIALLCLLLLGSLALSAWVLWPGRQAAYAEVWSQGERLYTLNLAIDREITVTAGKGTNVITVKDGQIAVTQANCPDSYCMDQGFRSGGLQIVCLPNGLEIRFLQASEVDGAAG